MTSHPAPAGRPAGAGGKPARGVPPECRHAYGRYLNALAKANLAERTRAARARCVRRFFRWLPEHTSDVAAVFTHPHNWAQATARFTASLCPPSGVLTTSAQWHADALADCARRLGLASTYATVPARYQWIHLAYDAALSNMTISAATATSYLHAVDAFLRWIDHTGRTADLRRNWGATASMYLEHLAAHGRAATTVRRRRVVLDHCAAALHLPPESTGIVAAVTRGAARPRRGESVLARYDWAGWSYYLLSSRSGTRVITTMADLPLTSDRPSHDEAPREPRGAETLLAEEIAGVMLRGSMDKRLAWAAVAGTQIVLVDDGDHAHLAERGLEGATTRRYPLDQALHAWYSRVGEHLSRLGQLHHE